MIVYDAVMRRLLALAVTVGAASCTSHPGFEVLDPCAGCARGDVAGGAVVHASALSWAARPGGGWVRVDDHDLAWADRDFHIDHETDVDLDGRLDVLAVAPDDTAFVAANTSDDFDLFVQLAAVAPDGSIRWRHDRVVDTAANIDVTATSDAVFVHGVTEYPRTIGGAEVSGVFIVKLAPATGIADWAWSSPTRGGANGLAVVPRADGTIVVAGTVSPPDSDTLDFAGITVTLNFASGAPTGIVGVLDAGGHGVWVRALTGSTRTELHQVGVLADGGLAIAGEFFGAPLDLGNGVVVPDGAPFANLFVGVLEADGTARWATPLGDGSVEITSLATVGDSVVIAGWYTDGTLGFGDDVVAQRDDGFLASLTGGAFDWVTEAHGPSYEHVTVVGRGDGLDAVVHDTGSTDPGPRSFDLGRVHVDGEAFLFANLIP
jgi:hypothetical protein